MRKNAIRLISGLLSVALLLPAADKYVCDTPQNGHACTYTNSQLQAALDSAQPGDTFYLQGGYTYLGGWIIRRSGTSGSPITVTSSRAAWLPGANTRITPSHIANIPMLVTTGANVPALSGALDGSGNPPSFWTFVGVGFGLQSSAEFDGSIVHTAGMGVNDWYIADTAHLPDTWVFDRALVMVPTNDSATVQNGVRLNGKNMVFRNSFIWPIFCSGIECHGLSTTTNIGPLSVTNNFISAASIPFLAGGTDPDYFGPILSNATFRYNYFFRPLKWWGSTSNPDRAYFLANGSKMPCTKNLFEFKGVDGALLEYNVHENVWVDNYCEGQFYSVALTPRQTAWANGPRAWGPGLLMGTLTSSGTAFSYTSTGTLNMLPGQNICYFPGGYTTDCRKIATVNNATKTGTLTLAFANAPITASSDWAWVSDPIARLNNFTIQNSVFRNVSGGFNLLSRDHHFAEGTEGRVTGMTVRNNLSISLLPGVAPTKAIQIYPQDLQSTSTPDLGGQDISFEHITFAWNTSNLPMYFAADNMTRIAKVQNLNIRSNILPDTVDAGDGNRYALGGSGYGFNYWSIAEGFVGSGSLSYNQFPWVGGTCSTLTCTGNQAQGSVSFLPGTYKLVPSSPLAKAGHDGTDIGVNPDQVPQIRNLKVTTSDRTALLEFDLTAPIADASGTQPCVLEVSANENLKSYLGTYTVINDLRPDYFQQADSSLRSGVVVANGHVSWPIGKAAVITGDDGQTHDAALTGSTSYVGRLMCYGDTQQFQFATLPTGSGASVLRLQFAPPAGVSTVRVDYGSSTGLASQTTGMVASGQAAVLLPAISGTHLYYQVSYLDGSGNAVWQGPIQIALP